MVKNRLQIGIINGGNFHKLIELIENQFKKKHDFIPPRKDICEVIAKAVIESKLF